MRDKLGEENFWDTNFKMASWILSRGIPYRLIDTVIKHNAHIMLSFEDIT